MHTGRTSEGFASLHIRHLIAKLSVDYNRNSRRATVFYFLWLAGALVVIVVAYRVWPGLGQCGTETIQLRLSALENAPTGRFPENCLLPEFKSSLWRETGAAVIALATLGVLVAVWWQESWDIIAERRRDLGPIYLIVGLVAALSAVAAAALTGSGLEVVELGYVLPFATVVATLSWVRWFLTGVLVFGFLSTAVSWTIRAVTELFRMAFDLADKPEDYQPDVVDWPPDDFTEPDFGVCLSGGGIRSAAYSLGALSALEETEVDKTGDGATAGLLGQANILSSVSGGGYAASAWRIAAGATKDEWTHRPLIGNPNNHVNTGSDGKGHHNHDGGGPPSGRSGLLTSRPDQPTEWLFPRLLARRRYLSNGRGALPATTVRVIAQLVWHFGLLLILVGLVMWLAGRLVGSPIITSPTGSVEYRRLSTPAVLMCALAAFVLFVRSFTIPGRARTAANYAIAAFSAIAVGLFVILVALPGFVRLLVPDLLTALPGGSGGTSAVATFLTGGVVAAIWRIVQAPIKTYAAYLGGFLLLVALLVFGGVVALHAATNTGMFSAGWAQWLAVAAVYGVVMTIVNPDLWSLHPIYRARLASTFANRRGPDGWTGLSRTDHAPLSHYADAPGPKQVICAVAARTNRSDTGVPVISMTFEPDYVTAHGGPSGSSKAIKTDEYERLYAGRLQGNQLQSVMGLTAISAAAVAPSLGRMNMGSTNALIAALNLRLGVWMPNPMYTDGRRAGTRMYSMFKEIFGMYDLTDPNLYVTDGGHWENLGLVELIRRRTRRIIAIDASADPPHSFSSLFEAVELALLECEATIMFLDGELAAMRPDDAARPAKNWAVADVGYSDGTTGRLLFVKAQASQAMPLDVLRYSKEDPAFPNYSTANQFLSEAEFTNLAILGRESVIRALEDKHEWLFGPRQHDTLDRAAHEDHDQDDVEGRIKRIPEPRHTPTASAASGAPTG